MAFTVGAKASVRESTLTTALVTTHLPLARVPRLITSKAVASTTFWLADLLVRLGRRTPRVVVASLNPHAGEGGLLGDEEQRLIRPGIRLARQRLSRRGIQAELTGPMGAETAFRYCVAGTYDGVVAMYHDQGHIAIKVHNFHESVTATLGIPFVRTSVDHGTAFDIAGRGVADSRGTEAALNMAMMLAQGALTGTT